MADDGDGHGNAIVLLVVHAVITYRDTLTIFAAVQKSQGEHREAQALIRSVLGSAPPKAEET